MYKWQPPEDPDRDLRVIETLETESSSEIQTGEDLSVDVESDFQNKPPKTALAKRFVELTGQGYKPHEAAKLMGTTMKGLVGKEAFTKAVQSLIKEASMVPELRKEMIRSGLNKIFMENVGNPDKESQKLAIEAAKVIGSDPDVGLTAQPQAGIQINLNTLGTVLDKANVIDVKLIEEDKEE